MYEEEQPKLCTGMSCKNEMEKVHEQEWVNKFINQVTKQIHTEVNQYA